MGPGEGLSLWVVTNICWKYRKDHFPYPYAWSAEPEYKFLTVLRPRRPYEVGHPYRDHIEVRLVDKAYDLIYEAYEELHGVSFPNISWGSMS